MKSPIKWAGAKSWLELPAHTGCWIEPFVGSAAQFFQRRPERAILCDSNPHLVNFYQVLAQAPYTLLGHIPAGVPDVETYLQLRNVHNHPPSGNTEVTRAATFYALNRTCFNGLWRENKRGEFNVPWCKDPTRTVTPTHFPEAALVLRRAEILCGDFTASCRLAEPGDTVYMDPPYYETWGDYTPGGFSPEDHIRVHAEAHALRERGVVVWLSYNDHPRIREAYADWSIQAMQAPRGVRGGRTQAAEILVTS